MFLYVAILFVVVIALLFLRRKNERRGKRCWQCGAPIDDASYMCPECGETLEEHEPDDDADPDADEYDDDEDDVRLNRH